MTGCSVRESNRAGLARRYPAVDLFLRPDEEPELVDRLGLASAQAPIGARRRDHDHGHGRAGRRTPTTSPARGPTRSPAAPSRAARAISAWLPIIYGCDKTCTYCIVPFSRGPERSRPFDEIVDEARALAAAGLPRGHAARPERQLLRPRPRARGALRARPHRARAGRPRSTATAAGPRRADPRDRRPAHRRRRAGDPAAAVRDLAPVGPVGPADRGDGRLPVGVRGAPPAGPVGRRRDAPADGPPVHDRALPRAARRGSARRCPGIALSTDVIVGFCGETEAQYEATLRLLETVRYDQVFAAAYCERPGTPATRLADDVPAAEKRRRLNELLALQEGIGLERNRAWLGRTTEVLVDTVVAAASHDHDDEAAGTTESRDAFAHLPDGVAHLAGRSRENKLVHVAGPPALVGRLVGVRVEHAGPYALRGLARLSDVDAPRRRSLVDRRRRPRPARPASRSRSPRRSRARRSPPRSSRPTRGRSTAASTSARPR